MNTSLLDQIVNAVLYEGYILYPYRSSAKKNRQRFTFGRVYPETYSLSQNGAEPFVIQTECLMRTRTETPTLNVSMRFLHPMAREVAAPSTSQSGPAKSGEPSFQMVSELRVDGNLFQTWQEAVEQEVKPDPLRLLWRSPCRSSFPFGFPSSRASEPIRDPDGRTAGMILRRQQELAGVVEIATEFLEPEFFKVTVRVLNRTPVVDSDLNDQNEILMRTFVSTHTILQVEGAEWISPTDPSPDCRQAAAGCKNIGTWPVLVGDEEKGERDTLLSSPIILSDYPRIAPESAGNYFDGTEIDEMLTLRIMTMTDEEKREMRHVDEHARRLLERTENLREDELLKLHGAMRAKRSFDEIIFGSNTRLQGVALGDIYLQPGDRVRIRPKSRADIMDIALAGKTAVIEAVEQDAEARVHLAVVVQDDPGKDLGMLRQPGHRFFYGLDEIEPLQEGL